MPNTHITSFENGMNRDLNVLLQPEGTYRYALNMNLITPDGNNYSFKDHLGNTLTFTLNRQYKDSPFSSSSFDVPGAPIMLISFPDKLIVLHTNDETENGGYGEIGMLEYDPYGEGVQPKSNGNNPLNVGYTPLYHHKELFFTKLRLGDGFGFPENDSTQNIYWTDNLNQPRVFNVADPVYRTYIASGSLIVGKQYMVIEGAISHNGVEYAPSNALFNIFTAVNANYTNLTGTTPSPKVIEYVDVKLLSFTPDRLTGNMTYHSYGTGSVNCGNKMYFYRLGLNSGYFTPWSYGSGLVHVGMANTYITTIPYHDFVGNGSDTTLENSGKSIKITIENIDTSYDIIQMACAEYDQSNTIIRQIVIVDNEPITGSTMILEHTGPSFGDLTLEDITLFPAVILKCKTMCTNRNYNLIGNLSERDEFSIDLSGATLAAFQYPLTCFENTIGCVTDAPIYTPPTPVVGANPAATTIRPNTRYLVTFGNLTTDQVVYNAVNYVTGQVITGVSASDTISFTGTASARPCVTQNRYTGSAGRRENATQFTNTNSFWDYKDPLVHQKCTGYWSGETYRFGILFYDLKGNPFYVRHLGDYQFPAAMTKGGVLLKQTYSGINSVYSLNVSGIKISNVIIPPAIMSQISGFSIVRAERDARIVTQGLVTQCTSNGASPTATVKNGAYIPISKDSHSVINRVYAFICPDLLVDAPLKKSVGVIGDKMESAAWLDPISYGGEYTRAFGGQEQIYSHIINPLISDTTLRTATINYFEEAVENQDITLSSSALFRNAMETGTGTAPSRGCIGGGAYNIDGFQAVGGKKHVFQAPVDFLHFGPSANNYTSNAAAGQQQKLLMNYVKSDFGNPYGGQGEVSLAGTYYISTGHYQPITQQVKTETINGSGNYVFNDIEVFGGDCYTCLIDYGYGLWNDDFGAPGTYSYGWMFPCECNSNYNLRRGRKTSTVELYYTGTPKLESIVYLTPGLATRLENYSYNKGYSSEGVTFKYPALPVNFINSGRFPFRIRFAGPKFLGETVDSFRTFLVNDLKDIDGKFGEINRLKVKDARVFVWQNKALTTVPIDERQLYGGALLGAATTLGTGGVVDRYDPINSYFGTQHQWSVIDTEYGFLYFDMRHRAVVAVDSGVLEASVIGGMKSWFSEIFLEVNGATVFDRNRLLNDPTFNVTSDRPWNGVGIVGVYDPKFKITYMTFKFYNQYAVSNQGNYLSKDFTIMYYHPKKMFIGFWDNVPAIWHEHNGVVMAANNPKNRTKYYGANMPSTAFEVGDRVKYGAIEYICISPLTIASYPGLAAQIPDAALSAFWTPINATNTLWVNNQPISLTATPAPGYNYNKVFGGVVSNEVEIIINPKTPDSFEVLSVGQVGPFNVNFTDIYYEAANQSSQDTNIKSTNRNFRFIWDTIWGNIAPSSTGRITNKYLKIKFVKKNWTGSAPTVVSTSVKILQYISSLFVPKK